MDNAVETSTQLIRHHLRRPHAGQRGQLTENATYTVNLILPAGIVGPREVLAGVAEVVGDLGQSAVGVFEEPVELLVHRGGGGLVVLLCSIAFTAGHMDLGHTAMRLAA